MGVKIMRDALEQMTMTELVRLQEDLARTLNSRFGKTLALAFTDIVGSTPYFARFGDQAGRRMQQRHLDLLARAVLAAGGRIVDTAGDGAFTCFPSVDRACVAMVEVMRLAAEDNQSTTHEHALKLRAGIHSGQVLTDGVSVAGDAVNVASRIASSADAAQLRLSGTAFSELPSRERSRCKSLGAVTMKGLGEPMALYAFEWMERPGFPDELMVLETGDLHVLPSQDLVRIGRLREHEGKPANDIVLELADMVLGRAISRWHLELRRGPGELRLRTVTDKPTELNGASLRLGEEVVLMTGAQVRLGNAVTLHFRSSDSLAGTPSGRFRALLDEDDEERTHALPLRGKRKE